jgi:hypothetical protein
MAPADDAPHGTVLFWTLFFAVVLAFLVASPVILSTLVVIIASYSIILITHSLTRTGRLSPIASTIRPLEWLARQLRHCAVYLVGFWALFALYLLIWPGIVVAAVCAGRAYAIRDALPLNTMASVTARFFRAEEACEWKSLSMLMAGIGHLSARQISNAGRYTVEGIGHPLQGFVGCPAMRRFRAMISKYAWAVANSHVADFVAERAVDVPSFTHSLYDFLSSIIMLIARGGVFTQQTSLQESYDETSMMGLAIVLELVLGFLWVLLFPFISLVEAQTQIKKDEVVKLMMFNSIIYNSLPLTTPVGKDIPKRGSVLVRLLTLLPGDRGHPIRCSLGVAELASPDMDDYEALSYVWGLPDANASIVVNDRPFRVSGSLFQALVHLRDKKSPRALWIDALCVNQNDLAERSSQVLCMHQIFSGAARVVVWLGEKEPWGLKHSISSIESRENDEFKLNVHFGITSVMSNLLKRPWWTRVWIVQEFLLARSVQIQCGTRRLSWDQFCVLVDGSGTRSFFQNNRVYYHEYQSLRRARELRSLRTSNSIVNKTRDLRSGDPRNNHLGRATDLLSLIYNFRSQRATEPRDKVFAFLGLAEDNREFRLFKPDYGRHISYLSIDLARQHIHHSRTLSVLSLAECTRKSPQPSESGSRKSDDYIPTWCPSFMSNDVYDGLQWRPFWTGLPAEESKFSATSHMSIPLSSTISSSPLVEFTTDQFNEQSYNLKIQVLSSFKSTISDDCRLEGVDELVAQTKTKFTWDSVVPIWRGLSQKVARMKTRSTKQLGSQGDDISAEELFHLTLTAGKFTAVPSANDPREEEYLETRRGVCSNRRFFATRDGRIGIGPDDLRVGDEVHVALGMQVPVILRKASDEWEDKYAGWIYIGQAYVHDRMVCRGDLKDDIESGRVGLEEMVLI